MEAFSVEAKFLGKQGFFSRFWSREYEGTIDLQPDDKLTMTGYDQVYESNDVLGFSIYYRDEGLEYLQVSMQGDKDYRFQLYHENAYKFFAWLIWQDARQYGLHTLREDEDNFRAHLEGPVLAQLRQWQAEEDKLIRRPKDDLTWEEVDENFRKWICAVAAINNMANGVDVHEFGGMSRFDPMGREYGRQVLRDSWEITTRAELIETIQDMVGENLLWQLLRTLQNAGWGYLSGLLTLREALNVAYTAGKRLQNVTRSWEGMGKGYLRSYKAYLGYSESYKKREAAFQQLMQDEDSLYKEVPFDMELVKSW